MLSDLLKLVLLNFIAQAISKEGGKKVIKRYSIFHFAAATVMTKIEIEAQVAVEEINFDEIKK